jgi:uncharacterized integral membrane protein
MIFGNLKSIVGDHYSSLGDETGFKYPFDYIALVLLFFVLPLSVGFILAFYVPIWSGFISASAPVLSVLTGFSINTIILLMRYEPEGDHFYEERTVQKTKEFTLYTILIGVIIIISLVFGFILTQINTENPVSLTLLVTGVVYSLIAHYFLTLLVITHRLWSLIHGDVI